MRSIIKLLLVIFAVFIFIFIGVVSQMIDVWVFGEASKTIDFVSGWIGFFIIAASLKELDNIYKQI